MTKKYIITKIFNQDLSIEPSIFIGSIILWLILGWVGVGLLALPLPQAILGSFVAVLLYWFSDFVHQLGHVYAANKTGYPMIGIHLGTFLFLSTSVYPKDEPALPGATHIRRALGGPIASLAFTLVTGLVARIVYPMGGLILWLALFTSLTNFFLFTIGALLPLGFTDGSTILKWWGKP